MNLLTWMNFWLLDILSSFLLVSPIGPKLGVTLLDELLEVDLPRRRETRHKLRLPERDGVALVHLPQMVHLTVQVDNLLHLGVLSGLGHARQDQHARLHLKNVAVPQLALVARQGGVQLRGDHVFNADEPGAFFGAIV